MLKVMSRSGSLSGSGRSTIVCTSEYIAVLAPIASASTPITHAANAG